MREIRPSGSEGGARSIPCPYPYRGLPPPSARGRPDFDRWNLMFPPARRHPAQNAQLMPNMKYNCPPRSTVPERPPPLMVASVIGMYWAPR